ncbi:MAG: toll/interleukin-1 receptor domain-containing protein [Planctomycetota bacterium]|nr:toll/interleukin-1 receptor domain-containing protein [Planctomycetota bacterium]
MSPYSVFTSYARRDAAGKPFSKFIAELKDRVQRKTGRDLASVCFVDGTGIKIGDDWTATLAEGVCTAEVIVCLMSPNYLNSVWCGRELSVFRQRIQEMRKTLPATTRLPAFIFPIVWEVLPGRSLPKVLASFQYSEDAFPPAYSEKGLRQLAQLPRLRTAFLEFLEFLSDRIRDSLEDRHRLAPHPRHAAGWQLRDWERLESAFVDTKRPYDVEVLSLVPGGPASIADARSQDLHEVVGQVAELLRVPARVSELVPTSLGAALHQNSQDRLTSVVILSASDPEFRGKLELLNAVGSTEFGLIVIDSLNDPTHRSLTLSRQISTLPARSLERALQEGRATSCAADELPCELERLFVLVRNRQMHNDKPAAAVDAATTAHATAEGVPTVQRPELTGPGGSATP